MGDDGGAWLERSSGARCRSGAWEVEEDGGWSERSSMAMLDVDPEPGRSGKVASVRGVAALDGDVLGEGGDVVIAQEQRRRWREKGIGRRRGAGRI